MRQFAIIHIKEGKITNPQVVRKAFEALKDGAYSVDINKLGKRTNQQNAWLHAVLPDILQGLRDAGYDEVQTTSDAKAVVKALFFKKKVSNGVDEIEVIEGTSEQTKIDFSEKAEEIIKWCAEYLNVDIAPPDKQLEFYD